MSDYKNVQYKDGKLRTNNSGSGGASSLSDLTDVDLTNIADGQILKWDATNSKWVNTNESGGLGHTYSTTEQVVGTWTDGRPVYEKTFELMPTSSGYYIDVTSLNIDFVVSLIGGVDQTSGNKVPIPYATASSDYALCYVNGGTKLMAVFAGSYNIAPWKVVLRWLKLSQ